MTVRMIRNTVVLCTLLDMISLTTLHALSAGLASRIILVLDRINPAAEICQTDIFSAK